MAFPEGEVPYSGRGYAGDSCYLENVLKWYVGNEIESVEIPGDSTSIWDRLKNAGKLFMKFVTEREKDELIPKIDFINHSNQETVLDILRTTYALDNVTLFSESGENLGDLNFWDEGFLQSLTMIGLSLEEILEIAPSPDGTYITPIEIGVENARISSYFGERIDPVYGKKKNHNGIDIAVRKGFPISTVASGEIIGADKMRGECGNIITIDHGNGVVSRYLHLHEFNVEVGDIVRQGDIIGTVGSTGKSTGNHLHFEIMKDGVYIDPLGIILGQ